ncbi:DMT family transporter [Paenibacillus sp. N1-5-1-14]|uniref:DMT family transporter n=1 Tax=Paenibacillus radicibacter TaxID=2972488 RepID=UPI0021590F30|nr:DMT family transporter [Paenibacillus radicibacter]MCR8644526.1 DMT family transporter [Paenibacillus radicibacter]
MEDIIRNQKSASQTQVASRKLNGVWLVVLGAAMWGVDPLFRILLLKSFTSTQIVLIEHILLMFYALPVLWIHRGELRKLQFRHIFAVLFISWGGSAIATIMFTSAFAYGNPNVVLLLQKLQPLFAIVMAHFVLKETLPKRFPILLLVALAGTYLLTFGWSGSGGSFAEVAGMSGLLSIGAAILWGGSTVMGRVLLNKINFESVTALRFAAALPLLLVTSWIEPSQWVMPSGAGEWSSVSISLLLQAFLPGLLSLLLYYKGLSNTKASYATLAELSFPAVGVLVNWLVFQQALTASQLVGFALIWGAIVVLSRAEK